MKNKKSSALSFKYLLFDFVRITAAPGLLFFRPKKIYISEKAKQHKFKGGNLIISNHVSLFDPMYLMLAIWNRRHHFVATKELFHGKFRTFLFTKAFLSILIDRENFSMNTLREIVDHLQAGEVVTMFPEGHVNVEKEGTKEFKSGMIIMALKSGMPIVPVYLKRREHWYSRVEVAVGEPIDVKSFAKGEKPTVNDVKEAAKYLENQEKELEELMLNRHLK